MADLLLRWVVNTIALLSVVYMMPGIRVEGWFTAFVAAILLGLLNASLRPIIIFLTFPFQVLTFGLFTLLINGFMFYLVSTLVPGFHISGFGNAFWGAILYSIVSFVLNLFVNPEGKVSIYFYRKGSGRLRSREDVIDVEGKSDHDHEK